MLRTPRTLAATTAVLLVLAAGQLATTACGGGDDSDDSVASLSDDSSGDQDQAASGADSDGKADEEALLAYAECMRDEGVDVPDPTVDEDGNLVLGGGPGGGGPPGTGASVPEERPDPDVLDAARDVCGDPPEDAFGTFSEEDQQELQDQALEFAQCMRDEGIEDFPDPDFSDVGPGGPASDGSGGDGEGQGQGGIFGSIDRDDPEIAAAFEACQSALPDRDGNS